MKSGDVAEYVLLPGDRGRVDLMCSYLESVVLSGSNREYAAKTGFFHEIRVTVMSTGRRARASCPG